MSGPTDPAKEWLRQQTRAMRPEAARLAALGVAQTALGVAQAWCVAGVLGVLLGGSADLPAGWLLALFAGAGALRAGLRWAAEMRAVAAGARARRSLREAAFSAVLDFGPALLRRHSTGDLVTLALDRIEALDGFFARWLPLSMIAISAPLLVGIAALAADPVAGLVLLGTGLLVPVGMALAGLGAAAASRRQFQALSRLQSRFLDRMRGISTIVLSGQGEAEVRALAAAADELRRRTMRVLRVAFLSSTALDAAMALALVATALRYGSAADPAAGLFSLLLIPEFFAPLRGFAAAYQDRMAASAAAEQFAAFPAVPPAQPTAVRTIAAHGVTVAFENVTLTWDASRGPALREVSFRVRPGETLVLAGPSGAGKSSVIEVLLGFVAPDAGRVTINGADLASIVPQALSRMTAWIGQRPMLFDGSLRDNIRFGRPDATDKDVQLAARHARVLGFAAALPQGLDTRIGEGGYGLSGGQAQRVAIARAFLKNAPLLLLDEPTAHLDPGTEAEVLDSLRRLAIGRTCILASHSAAAHGFGGRRLDLQDGQVVRARGAA